MAELAATQSQWPTLSEAWFNRDWATGLPAYLLGRFQQHAPADGAGLLLSHGGWLGPLQVCASAGLAQRVEDIQQVVGHSPAAYAFRSGRPVRLQRLGDSDDRWPSFAGQLTGDGDSALFSLPLTVDGIHLGVVDLYGTGSAAFDQADVVGARVQCARLGQDLLDLTSVNVGQQRLGPWFDQQGRVAESNQATGMVAAQLRVTVEEASLRLRAHAFAAGLPLREVVTEVLARRLRLEP